MTVPRIGTMTAAEAVVSVVLAEAVAAVVLAASAEAAVAEAAFQAAEAAADKREINIILEEHYVNRKRPGIFPRARH